MQQKDVQICDLLKNKDAKGMEFLFEEYYKPLVVWGDTFLNDVSRSEDLVQDFLIKLWEKRIGEKLEPSTLRSYLFVSIRNLALNAKVKVDPVRYVCDFAHLEKPWEEYDNIEEEVIQRIEREIKKLPSRSRDIIECVYLKGMRYKEVAAELNISVATVNTLLVNALKKLRQTTGKEESILIYWSCLSCCKSVAKA